MHFFGVILDIYHNIFKLKDILSLIYLKNC